MSHAKQNFRLETVLQLAREQTEAASREVGQLQHHRESAGQQLTTLAQYRNNYRAQLQSSGGAGVDVVRLRNYSAFIDRLGIAEKQQQGTVQAIEKRLSESRSAWLERQRREHSLDVLKARHVAAQRIIHERREQRENDEHAMKVFRAARRSKAATSETE
jgi:flagellar FliJ protein